MNNVISIGNSKLGAYNYITLTKDKLILANLHKYII